VRLEYLAGLDGFFVAALVLLAIVTNLNGFCPGYIPLGVSALAGGHNGADASPQPTAELGTPPLREVRSEMQHARVRWLDLG
jgi:hypothetical protein